MKCRLPMKIGTPSGGGGIALPEGAFVPATKFTDGRTYALVAKIDGVYRYINTTTYNDWTMNATEVAVTEKSGYVLFGSEPALFTAKASGDGFTLANGSNFLYGTSSGGTALRVGTTSAVWKVDTSETGGFASGKYLPKEVSSSVWLKNTANNYDWCIKYESGNKSFGYDRAGRDNTYSTGFVSFILYEKWEGQTGGGDSGGGDDSLDYHDNFADNDWATIAKVCAEGLVPTTWKVGDQKAMTINGTSYAIDIIGIQHDDFASGGKAPFTFQMHNSYNTGYKMNSSSTNSGGWNSCQMRTSTLPSILTKMPSDVQTAIKEVNKKTSAGNQSTTINTTADKLFLLSEIEVHGQATKSVSGEGQQYAYFSNGGSKIKTLNSKATIWWLRSPNKSNSTAFCDVGAQGQADATVAAPSGNYGAAFAFCLGNPVSGGSSGGGDTPTPSEYVLNFSGTFRAGYGSLTVSGKEYTTAQTLALAVGTEFVVTADNIYLNGTLVAQGNSYVAATYTMKLNSNVNIEFTEASGNYYTARITTE